MDLPDSWISCSLGEVINYGKTEKAEPQEIPDESWILELEDIERDTSTLLKRIQFSERQSKSTKNRFESGDVLYGKLRPYLNKVLIADQPGYCTTEIIPLRKSNQLDHRYLFYWLKHPLFLDYVSEVSHGLNMPRLGTAAGKAAPFVLAPLAEQKRIADKLEMLLGRVDACRARLDRVPALLKRFRQSVLAAATSGKLTEEWRMRTSQRSLQSEINSLTPAVKTRRGVSEHTGQVPQPLVEWECPPSWARVTAATLITKGLFRDLKDGNHGANHPKVSEFTKEGLPFITAAQVGGYRIDYDGAYKVAGTPLKKIRVGFAQSDDVILTHKGTVGRVAIADRDCVLTPQTTYYRTDREWILPEYLMFYLSSPPFSYQLDDIKSQTTRDFVPISQQYALGHLIPPVDEQQEIVRRVEALFAIADRIEANLTSAQKTVDRLTPATLAKAFRGELVPQDPNDEPASVLLERIQEQQATAPAKPKRSRKRAKKKPA